MPDEFKTARHHLLKNLDGCIAWKDPQQAVMQRERLQSAQETKMNHWKMFKKNLECTCNRCKGGTEKNEILCGLWQ